MANVSVTANIGKYHGIKYGNDGRPRISFSAAETARVKDQSGQYQDGGTTWFNVTLFGGASEALDAAIGAAGGKGKVAFSGRMSTREYEHNGEKRESLDVVADFIGLVPKNAQNGNQQQGNWNKPAAAAANPGGWSNGPGEEVPF